MTPTIKFLSCDWGTSTFRVRLVEETKVLDEFRSADGCRSIYERDRGGGPGSVESRARAYAQYLGEALNKWTGIGARLSAPVPLVISGMASSTIGWQEIPYASAPLSLDGSNLRFSTVEWDKPPFVGGTYIISGVATKDEIMRGEEIEAIGLLAEEPDAR